MNVKSDFGAKRRLLIDSDVLIDYLRNRKGIQAYFNQLRSDDLAVSHMSYAELLVGELYRHDLATAKERIGRLVSGYTMHSIDEAVIERYAELSSMLLRQGNRLAIADAMIAATALVHDRIVITRNLRHFERVPNLRFIAANIT